jgi:4-amino-4-deoxy-L-arabinose transferase-like glycosyltransferase
MVMRTDESMFQPSTGNAAHSSRAIRSVREEMIATVERAAGRKPVREVSAREGLSYLLFTVAASLYLLPFMRLLLQGTDEGTLVYGAVRIVHGQVFARDFFEVIGPGTFYWLAVFFKLFGVTFLAARTCLFLTSLGTAVLLYYLSRRVCSSYQLLPVALFFAASFGMFWPAISHHNDSNFVALLAFTCIVLWQDFRRNTLLCAAGALAGAATCILQPKGVSLLCAFLVWLWFENQRSRIPRWTPALLVAGYLSVVGLTLAYFWSRGALGSLIYANVLWPSRHYGAVNAVPYAQGILLCFWDHWVTALSGFRWRIPLAAVLIIPFMLVASLPALVFVAALPRGAGAFKTKLLPYWLCGGALWFSELHRKDIIHLVCGSPLLVIVCISVLSEYRSRIADVALQILSVSVACLAFFNLVLVLAAHRTATRIGPTGVFKDDPAVTFVSEHVAQGEEVFFYPYSPMGYVLTSTTNPTRYSFLMYNYNTSSQFLETVDVLQRHRVKYVLWDTTFESDAVPLIFPLGSRVPRDGLLMEAYLESHYRLVKSFDRVRVMERKSEDHAGYR